MTKKLYIITNGSLVDGLDKFLERIKQIVSRESARAYALVLREQVGGNPASDRMLYQAGLELKKICSAHAIKLIIHRRIDLALALNAEGVHLNSSTLSIQQARKVSAQQLLIGYSAHTAQDFQAAQQAGASYAFLSPIFQPLSKVHDTRCPLGIEVLKKITQTSRIPVIALGGITQANAAECINAGASGYGALGSLWD